MCNSRQHGAHWAANNILRFQLSDACSPLSLFHRIIAEMVNVNPPHSKKIPLYFGKHELEGLLVYILCDYSSPPRNNKNVIMSKLKEDLSTLSYYPTGIQLLFMTTAG